jgi:hypothetical protein
MDLADIAIVDLPRNGIATIGQINAATARVFNMGADLSSLLSTGGALDGGDILSQKMSVSKIQSYLFPIFVRSRE